MNDSTSQFEINDYHTFRKKMLNRANRFNIFCFLDNNGYRNETPAFECLLALGCRRQLTLHSGSAFDALKYFYDENPGWLFGHLGFALKSETTGVTNKKGGGDGFGDGFFFEPEFIIQLSEQQLSIIGDVNASLELFESICAEEILMHSETHPVISLKPLVSKPDYLKTIHQLKEHIHHGDCYEINYCHSFAASDASINPVQTYLNLSKISPAPFAAFYKLNEHYCICASPERYMKKNGNNLLSQPIKGTRKREGNFLADSLAIMELQNDAKERSENVMIVDLVRNDLSKICMEGSVHVSELFGVYSFPQVHQMISSVTGIMPASAHWTDALKATFPMGSMTGAPKKKVLQLIDQYETKARGLFSGSIGYVTTSGDFDFNVVIRSIFYDDEKNEISVTAGGGITFNSIAEAEYEESLLKAAALLRVLEM